MGFLWFSIIPVFGLPGCCLSSLECWLKNPKQTIFQYVKTRVPDISIRLIVCPTHEAYWHVTLSPSWWSCTWTTPRPLSSGLSLARQPLLSSQLCLARQRDVQRVFVHCFVFIEMLCCSLWKIVYRQNLAGGQLGVFSMSLDSIQGT